MYGDRVKALGNEILIGSVSIAFILALSTYIVTDLRPVPGEYGICLPSPNQWHIPSFLSWLLAVLVIVGTAFMQALTNKKYNLISTTEPLLPVVFVSLIACNTIVTDHIGTPVIMMAVNALCLYILFETYEKFNSTQEYFLLATFLSFGSMIEYSFLVMIPVYVVGGILMKSFKLREVIAFLFGLLAPYWILTGFGVIEINSFRLPASTALSLQLELNPSLFISLISVGVAGVVALVTSLYNSYSLLNGNAKLRSMHLAINIMGYICLIFMIGDYNNILAYSGTVYLWCALEGVALFTSNPGRSGLIWLLSFYLCFLVLYFIMLQ